jgi:hypothetical protein
MIRASRGTAFAPFPEYHGENPAEPPRLPAGYDDKINRYGFKADIATSTQSANASSIAV